LRERAVVTDSGLKGWGGARRHARREPTKGDSMEMAAAARQDQGVWPWWLILLEGIALLILGGLLLFNTAQTWVLTVFLLGIYWLIAGIFRIISIFIDSTMWGWKLVAGAIGIIAGIIILQYPIGGGFAVAAAIVLVLGIQGIIIGTVGVIAAFQGAGWGSGLMGALSVILGIFLLANWAEFTVITPVVVGIFMVVGGILAIVASFQLKSAQS
jgi:uncharacterized membrane protein HdeD (DUF308 family)